MNDLSRAPRPATWPARIRGMFNLNDPRWGRGDEPSNHDPQQHPDEPPHRPEQGGPPDLDELWRDFNRRLGGLFGGGGHGRRGGGFEPPDMKGAAGIGITLIVGLAVLIWFGTGVFTVREGEQAVVTTFGKFDSVRKAGLNWRWPWPIQRDEIVRVTQIRSVDVGGDSIVRATGLSESAMLTQDENIVEIKFAVQYRLNDVRAWLFESENPDKAVVQAADSAVREVAGQMTMDNAMTDQRDQIAPRVRDLMQKILDRYKVGVEVVAVNMQQTGVRPPQQVKDAFDDVIKAGQERERAKNLAQAYANQVVPLATGAAARLKQEADGYKARVVAQAQGDAQRFNSILAEYQKAPQVTRERMYLDTMRDIYSGIGKIIVDGKSGGNLMYLPLDKVMQAAGAAPATAASPAEAAPAPESDTADARARDSARGRERESR
ncbi:MAG: FtsH protease activity modulator HflK [Burkholderiaceae bacterium]|jgi:membrane protease subunit HflK|nr:FtsH protease activity modulator HflK [Burkholderiaceae bacterium]